MRGTLATLLLAALAPACGGSGGGGGGGPPPPPGPPFAQTTNTGLALAAGFAEAAVLEPLVAVAVSEFEMAADLNGDGDQLDRVIHTVDTTDGSQVNLALAVIGKILASDRRFAFLVSEGGQAATDLNGDGDASDAVWHVYDPSQAPAPPQNLSLATPFTGLAGAGTAGGFVLLQSEGASGGTDLNTDGDVADEVVRMFDGPTGTVLAQVAGPHVTATPLVARNGRVLVLTSEPGLGPVGADLNGDGDTLDNVLAVVDFTAGLAAFTNLGRAIANHPYALTDGEAVYLLDEASNGAADMNNDGDMTDAILAVFDLAGGSGEVTPFSAAVPAFALAATPVLGIAAGRNRIIVGIDEAANGNRDLNFDTDATDSLVGWVDTENAKSVLNLRQFVLGSVAPLIDGEQGLVAISELGQSVLGSDLNGDGDTDDVVAFALDTSAAPGALTNLGFAVATFRLEENDAFLSVPEAAQGGGDLNGDADGDDTVQFYFDLADQPASSRGLAIVASDLAFFRFSADELRVAFFIPEGQSPNFGDLNDDGDTDDTGLELVTLDPAQSPPAVVDPTPFFADIASPPGAPPLRCGTEVFLFPTSEDMAGEDMNGDGDLIDTVLRFVTYTPDED